MGGLPAARPGFSRGLAATLKGACAICFDVGLPAAPLSCCGSKICSTCARRWADMQVVGLGASELHCTICARALGDDELPALLDGSTLRIVRSRVRERTDF